ncbi:hypothetical protein OG836_04340 [Micromonospora zamorensis]|uniref:sigma factor-like helix-turn-helix DNA-binding protein n=1 Tax=Micromonospora zamorensis TaxID=709883 RepID=UPI002E1B4C4A
MTVLDSLRPDERLAFVLHDVFAVPHGEIGTILGRSTDATKMLTSRAARRCRPPGSPRAIDSSNVRWSRRSWPRPVRASSSGCWRFSTPT